MKPGQIPIRNESGLSGLLVAALLGDNEISILHHEELAFEPDGGLVISECNFNDSESKRFEFFRFPFYNLEA